MSADHLVSMVHARRRRRPRPPILLVPGSFSGAWIWQQGFQQALHRAGYDVHAMSFAAHGRRGLLLHRRGLRDYVDDLRGAVESLPAPPLLVAHSLGGRVALELVGTRDLPGLALLAPIPSQGAWRSLLGLGLRSPTSLVKLAAVAVAPGLARYGTPPTGIYGPDVDPRRATAITRQLQAESLRVLWEALLPRPLPTSPVRTPLHFFAASGDHVIAAAEVRRCAERLQAPFTLYQGMGHTLQAERDYARVCDDIVRWADHLR